MEGLITTISIDRETEQLISTSQNIEEVNPHQFSNSQHDEFCELMADEFVKFMKAQGRGLDEES